MRRRKMPVTPAHGTNPVHGAVIDSGTRGHNNQPTPIPSRRPAAKTDRHIPGTQIVASSTQDTYECDALVVGSGCAGMSAAVTAGHHGLNVLIVEKEPRFGGTTARSGGWLWIPGTSLARAWGIVESPDQARTYLRHEAGNSFDAARVDAFLTDGPEAVDFFTTKTALRFDMPLTFPDYHAEAPGGMHGGRSMVTRPFDGRQLGPHIEDLGAPLPELTVFGMMLGSGKEIIHFMRATKSLTSAAYVAKRLSKHFLDVMRHGRGMTLTNGNALAGRLAKSAIDLKIPLWISSPVRELIVEDGAVRGAIVERDGRLVCVKAKRGVVLACGGFPHDVARRKAMFPHAPTGNEHWSPCPTGNTGDGLRLAEAAGRRVENSLPNAAAWVPVSITERKDGSQGVMPHFIDRAKPGVIAVTRAGVRFANEGNSYHDFVQDMVKAAKPGEEITAFLICDHRTLRKYGLGCVPPFPMPLGITFARATSSAAGRWPRWRPRPVSMPRRWKRPLRSSTRMPWTDAIPISARVRAPITATRAMPSTARTPASRRSSTGRFMQSRW
jgi:hypothetical protein